MAKSEWEVVCTDARSHVRRLKIEGGWLYQVQTGSEWHDFNQQITRPTYGQTTFVPEAK